MRIAQISTLCTRVGQDRSGSVESFVWLLTRELTRLGHQVTVFAADGSEASGEIIATLPGPYAQNSSPHDWQLCEWINLCRAVEQSERFDVMHSHAYLWGLPLGKLAKAPMVHTLHIMPQYDSIRLRMMAPDACVTAISNYQWSDYPEFPPKTTIHHGVDSSQFTFCAQPDDYVCYLGRFTPGKGALRAISAARTLNLRLILAGPPNEYYRQRIEPLVDGKSVTFIGSVTGECRDRLLSGARALLYPVQEPEPFGLVQIEAMMCGTPVAAIRIGAVSEIIDDGVTGYCAGSADDFCRTVSLAMTLNREKVRSRALRRFSAEVMAKSYEQVYKDLVGDFPVL